MSETARLIGAEGASAARALPPGVRDLIRRRIARLPATARTTLRDAAIIGRDVDVDVVLAMEGTDEDTVLEGLEAGVLTGLLTEPAPGRVRFAHVLVRETLYEDTPVIRRTRLHGRVLDALERVRPGDVSALGHHALAAATPGTAGRALPYVMAAASAAAGLSAYREAGALYRGRSASPATTAPGSTCCAGWCAYRRRRATPWPPGRTGSGPSRWHGGSAPGSCGRSPRSRRR
nr:hypothetical protein GCM10020093_084720 [Planobispora longispora]